MIKNIIFDLGNVLLKFEPEKLVHQYIDEFDRAMLIYQNIFKSNEWIELDRGTINEQKAISSIINRIPDEAEVIQKIFKVWPSILIPIDQNIEIIKKLKKLDINLFILSNFHLRAYELVKKQYNFFSYFDGEVISCHVKLLKPDAEIYRTILHKYNLNTFETLFIDDMLANVEAAKTLGIKTIHYKGPEDFASKLKEYYIDL